MFKQEGVILIRLRLELANPQGFERLFQFLLCLLEEMTSAEMRNFYNTCNLGMANPCCQL